MERVVLASACRTPVGKLLGAFKDLSAVELGVLAVRDAIRRAGLRPEDVEEVLMGNALQAGLGQNPARQAALRAGCPPTVAATTVNKVCGSGLEAVLQAARAIKAGDARILVAGGMESMTGAPHLARVRGAPRFGDSTLVDHMVHDGLTDAFCCIPMSKTGEIVAERHRVTREEADRFALRSHQRALQATENGWFRDEVVPVEVEHPRAGRTTVSRDEGIRADTSLEKLARLATVAPDNRVVTPGNASQLSDGAGALVVMAASEAQRRGIQPLATLRAYSTTGTKPEWIMEAPIAGARELLKREGLRVEDVDLVEHNEAFATASVAVQRELGVPDERFNVHGGAVAMGHPIGASGARILSTLIYALQRRGLHRGLATICLGGGNAVQCIVER
jgi:acetyl-CoA C-acetyltransferase